VRWTFPLSLKLNPSLMIISRWSNYLWPLDVLFQLLSFRLDGDDKFLFFTRSILSIGIHNSVQCFIRVVDRV
jgi:hypothetical protein